MITLEDGKIIKKNKSNYLTLDRPSASVSFIIFSAALWQGQPILLHIDIQVHP